MRSPFIIPSPFKGAPFFGAVDPYAVLGFRPKTVTDFAKGRYRFNDTVGAFSDLTYTRASTATYVDRNGLLQTAASGVPRQGHHRWDGTKWVNKGLLFESEARTNDLSYSEDFTQAYWSKTNTAALAVDAVGPYSTLSAVTLRDNSAGGSGLLELAIFAKIVTVSTTYTYSCFAKAGSLDWLNLRTGGFTNPPNGGAFFNLLTGVIGTVTSGYTAKMQDIGNGWFRCSITFTTDAVDNTGAFYIAAASIDGAASVPLNGTSNILIYGAQLEVGAIPSSYIPTTGATATRAAETLFVPAAKMAYDTTSMWFHMRGEMNYIDENAFSTVYFMRWFATSDENILIKIDTDSPAIDKASVVQEAGGIVDFVQRNGVYSAGLDVPFNIATRNGVGHLNIAAEGVAGVADLTPTTMPAVSGTNFQIGLDFMGTIELFRQGTGDPGDAGIEEAST